MMQKKSNITHFQEPQIKFFITKKLFKLTILLPKTL